MEFNTNTTKLAQSASALGAGLLGFGLGAKWGDIISSYALIVVIVGSIFHIWGMYVMQMKNQSKNTATIARILWISAWICLIAVIVIIGFLLLTKKN